MAKNGRQIGAAAERALAHLLQKYGFEARRGQQFKGTKDSPDVIHDMAGFFIECKKREGFTFPAMYEALAKAQSEAPEGHRSIVFHKRNRKPWIVVMDADEFMTLMQEIYE